MIDRFFDWASRKALFLFFLVMLVVACLGFLSACDGTYTITSECLFPDSVVTRQDGTVVTYWPEGCP